MKKEILLYTRYFEPQDELVEYVKSLGYNNFYDFEVQYDERVVQFVKERMTEKLWDYFIYKGKKSYKFRIGFAGFVVVAEVDTDKDWIVQENNTGKPYIQYVKIVRNKYGKIKVEKEN